jgi:hypothetical protein
MPHRAAVYLVDTTHPIFAGLGWRRPPKGRTKQVVEKLCEPFNRSDPTDLDTDGLASNAAIAKALAVSEKTVKVHIAKAARDVNGLEMLRARARIFVCYHHELWRDRWRTPPVGVPSLPSSPTGTSQLM